MLSAEVGFVRDTPIGVSEPHDYLDMGRGAEGWDGSAISGSNIWMGAGVMR